VSIVIGVAFQEHLIMMSDGRARYGNAPRTNPSAYTRIVSVNEEYKKLFVVNKDICIGFTGGTDVCEAVINSLNTARKDLLSLELVVEILHSHAIEETQKPEHEFKKIAILVGGVNANREIEMCGFSKSSSFSIISKIPQRGSLEFYVINDTVNSDDFKKHILDYRVVRNREEMVMIMKKFIDKVAMIDDTVNTNTFVEFVDI
jgi:hypothetical protein